VRFLGGHGTSKPDGTREDIYNNTHTADPDLKRRWDGQYASLWVTNGGGGRFVNIWTPSTFAQAGLYVSDTETEGRVYQMSSEHHVRAELVMRNAANWSLFAFQGEEERGESAQALPIEIDRSRNILIANLNLYRVVSSADPFPYAIKVSASENIRFRNVHCYSDSKVSFDNLVYDATHGLEMRQRELAWLTLSGRKPVKPTRAASPIRAAEARVEKLASGFDNISGGAVDSRGDFYFVDARGQRIHRWSVETRQLSTVRDSPLDPVNLVFDQADNLLVLSAAGAGNVYTFRPDAPGLGVTLLTAQPAAPRPGLTAVLPADHFRHEHDFLETAGEARPHHFVSPDGTTFIPAGDDFLAGRMYYGAKFHDVLRAFGLIKAVPGQRVYVSEESQQETYTAVVDERGQLKDLKLFLPRGGEGVAVDADENVYLADGHIRVYDRSGREIDVIEVPERPQQIVFGGRDGRTLFIAARSSLYAIPLRVAGRTPR
jgi:sugar lactone lactonase YvrE